MKRFLLFIILAGVLADSRGQSKLRILFVGNSLTYTNDLPATLREIGKLQGVTIHYKLFLFPDYSLEDHWNQKNVINEIGSKKYDFVIAQQGPSALPESQKLLREYSSKFADVCKKNGTQLVLCMVWPSKARSFDFENVINSYSQAASAAGSLLCPAGEAWHKAQEMDSQIILYGPDNFHPNRAGSFLAAMTLYATLNHKADLSQLDYGKLSIRFEVTRQQFNTLCQAAIFSLKD